MGFFISGCSYPEVVSSQLYNEIDQNPCLTQSEKAYAKRAYQLVVKLQKSSSTPINTDAYFEEVASDIFKSEVYRKWGLGDKTSFSSEEKLYIVQLPQIEEAWKRYKSIDINDLSEPEKKFLKEMHEKYGQGPINLREVMRQEYGELSLHQENIFDVVEAPSGREKLYDIDLVFYYRILPK